MRLAVSVGDLRKDYVLSGETVHALRGVSFDVPEGDYISIMGPSGSGKSTLLNLLGCLDRPYNLLAALSVVENIEVPLYYSRRLNPESKRRCIELAEMVGLKDRLNHRPSQLSGGQQQRVAIARSLVNNPEFILADEPTGNLDTKTSHEILDLLARLNNEGRTIIMVTHEPDVAARTKRSIHLLDGRVVSDERTSRN
jgi:putative ABC transport system ATP-binding protein